MCPASGYKKDKTIKEVHDAFNLGQGTLNTWIKHYFGALSQLEKRAMTNANGYLKK